MGRNPFWAALDVVLVVKTEEGASGHPEWSWKAYVPHGVPVHELVPVDVPSPGGGPGWGLSPGGEAESGPGAGAPGGFGSCFFP